MRRHSACALSSLLACLAASAACTLRAAGDDGPDAGLAGGDAGAIDPDGDPLAGLPTGPDSWTRLCASGHDDMVSKAFCQGGSPPSIHSLADLRALLHLDIDADSPQVGTSFVMLGHSSAISGRTVTPLNPRAILFTAPLTGAPNPDYDVLAFSRGEPFVELAARDPASGGARFFLVRFQLACEPSCNFADVLTPSVESGWTGWSVYDDDAIKDTTLDCLQCHQPGGPGTPRMLRMQELTNPWTHWFYEERAPNLAMEDDYLAAHAGESYAGIPSNLVKPSRPFRMEFLVENNGFKTQPNAFASQAIVDEISSGGSSPTWQGIYANAVAGQAIAVPYFATPTDPTKVTAAIQAYQDTISGALPPDQMPDIRDTLLDGALADMSISPKPGLDGHGILVHMCQHCHNSHLDQTISRAGFNVETLASLPDDEKQEAIRRIQLPAGDRHRMPPPRYHILSRDEIDLVVQELGK